MKQNYDVLMQEQINKLDHRPKLLLHSCCGPCSTACIERLTDNFDVSVLYYNPNIEPREEYELRKKNQKKFLDAIGIELIDCDYNNETFRDKTKGLEEEPEGGARCSVCFTLRLEYTADKAKELGFEYFTTTLTVSPYKNSQIINQIGSRIGEQKGINYLYADFKKHEGYKRSIELAKKYDLYRQHYCGCLFSKDIEKGE